MDIITLSLLFLHATLTTAYPSGAPISACPGLLPLHHGTAPQTTNSPFEIGVSSVKYSPNTPITVTIQSVGGSESFMAFLLQARVKGTNTSVGHFTDAPGLTRIFRCFSDGDSITHSAAQSRTKLQLTWVPPANDMGEIEIRGAVAQSKLVYWGVLSSGPLAFTTSGSTGTSGDTSWMGSARISSNASFTLTILMCAVVALVRHMITNSQ